MISNANKTSTQNPSPLAATADQPAATADQPAGTADQPAATADQPAATADQPAATADQIVQLAEKSLRDSNYWPLRQVRCSFDQGRLTLSGKVPSFYLKQVAQSVVRRAETSVQIDNRLEVSEA